MSKFKVIFVSVCNGRGDYLCLLLKYQNNKLIYREFHVIFR